jgi:hypothetical protein
MATAKLTDMGDQSYLISHIHSCVFYDTKSGPQRKRRKCLAIIIHDQRGKILIAAMQQDLIAIRPHLLLLKASAKTHSDKVVAACAFCNATIPFGQSVCSCCMKKYNIGPYDLDSDGCGCDR